MSFIGQQDLMLEIPRGTISGVTSANKFGHAPNGVQTTKTDIWDRADATPTQQIWVAPTQARIHDIVSTSDNDSGGGTGMRTMRVSGLQNWGTNETSEDITLLGNVTVQTLSSYVIIHRMQALTKGAGSANFGVIHAVAGIDSSITAQINAGEGQTQMAIYGLPSSQTAYMTKYYFSFNKAGGATSFIDIGVLINPEPDAELTNFLVKHDQGAQSNGTSDPEHEFLPYFKIPGPAIVKMEGIASTADADASAGFDLILVDN